MPVLSHITGLMPRRPAWYANKLLEECGILHPPIDCGIVLDRLGLTVEEFRPEECPIAGLDKKKLEEMAFLVPQERRIFVPRRMKHERKRLSILHECGHSGLPWHHGINYFCDDRKLSYFAREQLEQEAFDFASNLMMPRCMFVEDVLSLPTGLDAIFQLKDRYEASIIATAIWYAKVNPGLCMLVVLGTPLKPKKEMADMEHWPLQVHYSFPSQRFETFIHRGVDVHWETALYSLWEQAGRPGSVVRAEIPMTDFGPSFWDHKYRVQVECRSYGQDGTMMALLWLPDNQLKLEL